MANEVTGVGTWIWKTSSMTNNVNRLINTGVSYVLIKVNDGNRSYNDGDELRKLCSYFNNAGIRVFGWGYIRPDNIEETAKLAAIRCKALGMEYYSVDFEREFEQIPFSQSAILAKKFITAWQKEAPNVKLFGSSFYTLEKHAGVPYAEFMKGCDYWQPQVYWENNSPIATVQKAFDSGKKLKKPMVITLPSYDMRGEGGKMPTTEDMVAACDKCFALGAKAVDFFSFDEAVNNLVLLTGISLSAKKHKV